MDFSRRLVLNQYLLSLFGHDTFEALAEPLQDSSLEHLDDDDVSPIHTALVDHLPDTSELNDEVLLAYDQNIVAHTKAINRNRSRRPEVRWKYFQYLALLFTETYLDRFFQAPDLLLEALNAHVEAFNQGKDEVDQVGAYAPEDLRKLAFWSATGSGKTLLMHVNILQYRRHLANRGRQRDLNRTILLTPNEGLSYQHVNDLKESGIEAEVFSPARRGLLAGQAVDVIDIHKLREEEGEKTIAVDAFEGNNLVLVDEGHRGAGGAEWMDRRNRLCEDGFSFEYSATFGQAMRAANKSDLVEEYARCILFDYSYRHFYAAGYGKDYRILNLADDEDEDVRVLYLTAALLTFYQQLRLYCDDSDRGFAFRDFHLERPLWIFVGSSVTKTTSKKDITDIEDILMFLAHFVGDGDAAVRRVERILNGKSGLLDKEGLELFPVTFFEHLTSLKMASSQIYEDVLRLVFNSAGRGKLHVDRLKNVADEIALRLGDNDPFGVVTVSSVKKLCDRCATHGEMAVGEREFGESLFRGLNDSASSVNLLVGARKFTEGWSSWRVSSMGLMNIGRNEGPQIIQLFGRGVRLKGYDFGLKRSSCLEGVRVPDGARTLETLNIFGIRADYMRQFKDYLEEEGLPTEARQVEEMLPVIINLEERGLKTLTLPDDLRGNYRRRAPAIELDLPPDGLRPIVLDWYPRIQAEQSSGVRGATALADRETGKLRPKHVAFLDLDTIFFELIRFKNDREWYNFNLTLDKVRSLLDCYDWYILFIPPEELESTSFARVRRWQELAVALLKKYCDRYYKYRQAEWERPHLQYADVTKHDGNFAFAQDGGYRLMVDATNAAVTSKLKELKDLIRLKELKDLIAQGKLDDFEFGNFKALFFSRHLYQPLIHLGRSEITVSPVALNRGERDFVQHLRSYYEEQQDGFFRDRQLYLLRNMSRGRGIGFFGANRFFPDFIVWLLEGAKQYVTFVDPKGIRNLRGLDDPKIAFHAEIKKEERRLGDPNVVLNSFIVSNTPLRNVKWWTHDRQLEAEFEERHVLFQDDPTYIQKMFCLMRSTPTAEEPR